MPDMSCPFCKATTAEHVEGCQFDALRGWVDLIHSNVDSLRHEMRTALVLLRELRIESMTRTANLLGGYAPVSNQQVTLPLGLVPNSARSLAEVPSSIDRSPVYGPFVIGPEVTGSIDRSSVFEPEGHYPMTGVDAQIRDLSGAIAWTYSMSSNMPGVEYVDMPITCERLHTAGATPTEPYVQHKYSVGNQVPQEPSKTAYDRLLDDE